MARQRSKFTYRSTSDLSLAHSVGSRRSQSQKQVSTDGKTIRDGPSLIIGDVDVIRYRSQVKLIAADKAYEREVRRACINSNRTNFNGYCRSLQQLLPCRTTMYRKLSPIPEETEQMLLEEGAGDFLKQQGFRQTPNPVILLEQKLRNMQALNPVMIDLDKFLENKLAVTDFSVLSCIDYDDNSNNDSKESGSRAAERKKRLSAKKRTLLSSLKTEQDKTRRFEEPVPLPPPPECHLDPGTGTVGSANCDLDSHSQDHDEQNLTVEDGLPKATGATKLSASPTTTIATLAQSHIPQFKKNQKGSGDTKIQFDPVFAPDKIPSQSPSSKTDDFYNPFWIDFRYVVDVTGPYPKILGKRTSKHPDSWK